MIPKAAVAGLLPGGPQWQGVDLCRDPLAALWQGPGALGPWFYQFASTKIDVPRRFLGLELVFTGIFEDAVYIFSYRNIRHILE